MPAMLSGRPHSLWMINMSGFEILFLLASILFSVISASYILLCWTSIWGELWKNLKLSPVVFLPRHIRHSSLRYICFCAFHDQNYIFFLESMHHRIRPLISGLRSATSTLVLGHRHQEDLREQLQLLLKWALWCDVHPFPGHLPLQSPLIIIIITTRPKPPFGRQGLAGLWARIQSGGYISPMEMEPK